MMTNAERHVIANIALVHTSCNRRPKWYVCALLLLGSALFAQSQQNPTAASQQPARTAPQVAQVLPSYEGQNVSKIEIAGQPGLEYEQLMPLLAQKEGQPFSRDKVDQSVAALKQTGRFKDVQLQVVPEIGGVRVMLVVQPGIYFGMYFFPGAVHRYSYTRLLQVSTYPPQGPYSKYDIDNATQELLKFFRRTGYFQAEVRPELQVDQQHGLANVAFHTTLNRRAKFGKVSLQGTTPEESANLQDKLHSVLARLRGSAIRPGKTYSLKTLQNATLYLQNALIKQAHLGAQVKLIGANYDEATNRADIVFNVQPGPVVHVKVQGAHLWSWTEKKLLPIVQNGLDPELVQEGRANLISYFQSKGYFNVQVRADTEEQPNGDTVLYQITKGPRHKVDDVDVAGNQTLSTDRLMKSLTVEQGHFLVSHGKYSEKLVRQSVKNLEGIYRAAGFSAVKVVPQVKTDGGDVSVTFNVNEGTRDVVEALRIEGNDTLSPAQMAPKGLKLGPGRPYSQKLVDQDRDQIVARYLELGYLTATFRETARPASNDPHRIEVVYLIHEGPKVYTSSVVTLGRKQTRQQLINRAANLRAGTPMREDQMLTSESELYTLGVFDWAEIDPRRQITTQTSEDAVVKVHEAKRNSITYGFGFEVINRGGSVPSGTVAVPGLPPVGLSKSFKTSEKTFWGPRGSFEYTRKNLRGRAETLTFSGLAGRLDQRGSITYQDPHFRSTDWSSNFTVSGEHDSQNPIFTSRLAQFSWQLQHALDEQKIKNFFFRYSYQQTGLTRLLIPDLVPPEDMHVRLSTLSGTYIRDTRDNSLDAHKGMYQSFELDFNPTALGSSVNFARLLGQTAYYKKIPAKIVWANSLRLGFEEPFAGSHVPISEAFFSGGGSTLRGFPLNGAGPQRTIQACGTPGDLSTCSPITVPIGGRQLVILNSEFRIPIPISLPLVDKKLSVVPFYDGGNVFPHIGFHGQWTNTFGGGIRYETPIGPVRIDVGHNLNALPGIKATQIFVTLGQAF